MNTRITPPSPRLRRPRAADRTVHDGGHPVVLAATMNRTIGTASNNARNNQYVAGLYAAEAATEKVFGMMKSDFLACNLTALPTT